MALSGHSAIKLNIVNQEQSRNVFHVNMLKPIKQLREKRKCKQKLTNFKQANDNESLAGQYLYLHLHK